MVGQAQGQPRRSQGRRDVVLLAAHAHGPQGPPLVRRQCAQLPGVDPRHAAAAVRVHAVAGHLDGENVVGHQRRSARRYPAGQRGLAGARGAQEGDCATPQGHGAGVQDVQAAQDGGQRQDLGEDEALPAPSRPGRRCAGRVPPVGRDEVAPVARRPDAEAHVVVALHGEPDRPVREPPLEQRARAGLAPPAVDGGARRALEPGVGSRDGARGHYALERERPRQVQSEGTPTTNRRAAGGARSAAKVGRRGPCPPARR